MSACKETEQERVVKPTHHARLNRYEQTIGTRQVLQLNNSSVTLNESEKRSGARSSELLDVVPCLHD